MVSDEELANNPLTITMSYTADMLAAAGAASDADINIYRFDYDRNMYVCVTDCVQDKVNMTVTAPIAQHGEYILATDNASPLVSDFALSDETATPTITVLVSDLSGIGEFAFWLDEGEVLVDSDSFAQYYDSRTGLFTYKVTQPLTAGEHTAYFRAADTLGNANAEPFSFTFTVDANAPVIVDVTVPAQTVTSGEEFVVTAVVADDKALSQVMARITAGEVVTTLSMTQDGAVWRTAVNGITGTVQTTVEIIAVDMAGNRSQSHPVTVDIDIPEPPTGIQVSAERTGGKVDIAVGSYQQAVGGWLIAAVYDAEGKMLGMSSEYVGIKNGEALNLTLSFDCKAEEIASGKVFFLDVSADHAAMRPACDFK